MPEQRDYWEYDVVVASLAFTQIAAVRFRVLLPYKNILKTKEIQLDKKNSQYGKIWICHLDKKENKKIELAELPSYIILGWITGRVAKFNGQVAQLVETR